MSKINLSPETKLKIVKHLKKHWEEPRNCPVCKKTDWYLQPGELIRPIEEFRRPDHSPLFIPGDGTIPTIQAMCETCFYVHTFLLLPILEGQEDSNG